MPPAHAASARAAAYHPLVTTAPTPVGSHAPRAPEASDRRAAGLGYRPDIDGLRAVAVLLVLAFHLGISGAARGFVGVDVFLVISGYLISSHVLAELAARRFRLSAFYERRVRRLLPALVATFAGAAAAATAVLLPAELADFGRSLAAAALSGANVYFWLQTGYFAPAATSAPLLHTWSLGVEEQFYVALPLALAGVWRLQPRWVWPAVLGAAVLSLGAAAAALPGHPDAVFYLAPFRAWELLLGTMLAIRPLPGVRGRAARELAAAAGLVLIAVCALAPTDLLAPLGLAALGPCFGAALVIGAGQAGPSWTARALSLPPAVGVGLISYSLYLWHWPIIVFARMGALPLGLAGWREKVALGLISLGVAAVSWRLVERPFRTGRLRLSRRTLFATAAGATGVAACTGAAFVRSRGLPGRFPPEAVQVASYLGYIPHPRPEICFLHTEVEGGFAAFQTAACLRRSDTKPNVLVFGDSHADHLWYGLAHMYSEWNVLEATASGCKPLVEARAGDADRCRRVVDMILSDSAARRPVDRILLAARWDAHDVPGIDTTVAWARRRGLPVTVVGPIPQYDTPVPRLLAQALRSGDHGVFVRHRIRAAWPLDSVMEARARDVWHVPYVSLVRALCGPRGCLTYADAERRVPLQFDNSHLTPAGSVRVAERLRAQALLPVGVR